MKKTTFHNRVLLTLIGFLAFLNISISQSVTCGSSTVNLLIGAQYSCTGNFSGFPQGVYTVVLTQSGSMSVSGLAIDYNDGYHGLIPYINGNNLYIDGSGSYPFTLIFSAPSAFCGAQSKVTFGLTCSGCNAITNSCTVNIINQTITGNTYVCENATNTYTLSQNGNMGSIAAGGKYTWSLKPTQAGWKINGNSVASGATYTLPASTATSVSITSPSSGAAGNATLTVSGANMCSAASETITTNLPQPTLSKFYPSICMQGTYGYPVTWIVNKEKCATSYTWSYTGTSSGGLMLSPSTDGSSCYIAPMALGTYTINVIAKNSYTSSSAVSVHTRVISYDPIHCGNNARMDENNTDAAIISDENISEITSTEIYPNPASQSVNVRLAADKNDNYSITIYNIIGKQVYTSNDFYSEGSHEIAIDVKDLPNGIYFVVAGNGDNRTSQKLIITHQ